MTVVEPASSVIAESIVIDGCAFFPRDWGERQVVSGITALQVTVPMPWFDAREALHSIHAHLDLCDREPRYTIIKSIADILQAKAEGKVGLILGAQSARYFEYDVRLVEDVRTIGIRVTQLTYSDRNLLGDGCLEPTNVGLSRYGKQIVSEMNRVGIQIDLSHVGERTSLEAMEHSTKPCIFSHSNPKARSDNPRNLTDEQIKMCADRGGVIGLTPYAPANWVGGSEPPNIDDLIGHIEYVVDLTGADHVSIGSDSEITPGAYPAQVTQRLAGEFPEASAALRSGFPDVRRTKGFESMEAFPSLAEKLLDRGWTREDVKKLLGENLLRVYGQNWQVER